MRVIGTALAQHLVDQHDQDRAEAGADDAAAAAEDRGAADDHRGDDDQLGAEAVLRRDALVLGDVIRPASVAQSDESR